MWSASNRGYGKVWQRESRRFLQTYSLYAECAQAGRYVKATVVDHIVSDRGDEKLFWDPNNWQPLCKQRHNQKTMTEDRCPQYHYCPSSGLGSNLYTLLQEDWRPLSRDNPQN